MDTSIFSIAIRPIVGCSLLRIALLLIVSLSAWRARAADGASPTARIVGRNESFATIQEAINAAEKGDVIELPAGRFDERITIAKNVKLVGAGAEDDGTVIGPTAEGQAALRESYEGLWKSYEQAAREIESQQPRRDYTEAEREDFQRKYDEVRRLEARYAQPIVEVGNGAEVEFRALKVTMPDAPQRGGDKATSLL